MSHAPLDAILFDKDGTLLDFHATWSAFAAGAVRDFAGPDPALRAALAQAWGFDLDTGRFADDSPAIAGTNRDLARLAAGVLPGGDAVDIERRLSDAVAAAPVVEVLPLAPLLLQLSAAGLALGVVTNDAEAAARAHMAQLGVLDCFALVIGSDSGLGAKPDPDPLLAAAARLGTEPARMAMVGDSTHDLRAGRAAGMVTVAVLTGTARADDLAPWADHVVPDVAHLPAVFGLG